MYEAIVGWFSNLFFSLESVVPERYRVLLSLLVYTIFIVLYGVFIWKFYRFIARREVIKLNLSQYNHMKHEKLEKFLEVLLNTIEYVIVLPFLVLFWFSVFSIFLLVLSKTQSTYQILLISAAIIASTRITSYISEDLSKDIAKIFPFTVLALFLLDPDSFSLKLIFDRIGQIPELLTNIFMFVLFIFVIEMLLRVVYSIYKFFYSEEEEDEK